MKLHDLPLWASDNPRSFQDTGYQGAGWTIVAPEIPYSRSDTFLTPHFKAMRKKYPEYSTSLLSMVGKPAERVRIAPQVKVYAPSRLHRDDIRRDKRPRIVPSSRSNRDHHDSPFSHVCRIPVEAACRLPGL